MHRNLHNASDAKCLSSEPNDESAANVDAAKKWRQNRNEFNEIAKRSVRKSLGL